MSTTSSIGSASRNYSTITAWNAAFANGGWIGQCYNDSEFSASETFPINFTQATSVTNFITLQTGTGQSYRDNVNVQTNRFAYVQANGVGVKRTANYGSVFGVASDYVTIQWLQINHTGNNPNLAEVFFSSTSTTHSLLDSCIVEATNGSTPGLLAMDSGKCINSLFVNSGSTGNAVFSDYNAVGTIANCTFVRTSNNAAAGTCFNTKSGSTQVVKNCAVFGYSTIFNNTALFTGSDYIGTDQATVGVGTHNVTSIPFTTATFKVVTNTNHDYKLVTGSNLLNVGLTDTTDIPAAIDAVGTSRPQGSAWDIGAWELVVAAAVASGSTLAMMGIG